MRKIVIFIFFFLSLFAYFPVVNATSHENSTANTPATSPSAAQTMGTLGKNDTTQSGSKDGVVTLPNPLGAGMTLEKLIGKIIRLMLGLAGSAALVMFVYGGFTWVLSAGNPESMQRGKNILIWAVVGLIVIFSSYAILRTLLGGLS